MAAAAVCRPTTTAVSQKTAVLSLPGFCTGDIWHTAAAGLLLRDRPFLAAGRCNVLITLPEDARQGIITGHASVMYDYLKHLGLTCIVAKLPAAGPAAGDEHCENAAALFIPQQIDRLLATQSQQP